MRDLLDFIFDRFFEFGIDQGWEGFDVLEVIDGGVLFILVCETVAFSKGG